MHRMGYNVGVNKDGGRQTNNTATGKDVKNENYRKRIPSSNCHHHHKPQHVAGRGDGPGRMALQQRLGRVGDRRRRFWARGPGDGLLSPQPGRCRIGGTITASNGTATTHLQFGKTEKNYNVSPPRRDEGRKE